MAIIQTMQLSSPQAKPIRITKIPITIRDNPKLLNGLARFTTQSFKTNLGAFQAQAVIKKNTLYYRSYGDKQEEQQNEQQRRKKEVQVVEASIRCRKIKNRVFRMQMPVVRGPKSLKNPKYSKATEMFFILNFNNYQGTLTLLTGMYDIKNEAANKQQLTFAQKVQKQSAMIDNRRKDDLKSLLKKKPAGSDSQEDVSQ